MIILAVDTTAKTAAAAICDGETPLASFTRTGGISHSEAMLPAIDGLFRRCGLTPRDVGLFAVSEGPGSFTGVRIGVSLIKGLAFGTGKPCVGVSTLSALAENGSELAKNGDFIACPVMDARRDQMYNALFSCVNGTLERLCPDRLISASELKEELEKLSLPVYFFGDGYYLAKAAFAGAKDTPDSAILQNAVSVARAALGKYMQTPDKSQFTDLALTPSYLRSSQAEREYGKKENQ